MTFKDFTEAIKKDPKLMELLDQCDRSCEPLTDAETWELVERTERACSTLDPDFLPDDFRVEEWDDDPLQYESPVDLYGPYWE